MANIIVDFTETGEPEFDAQGFVGTECKKHLKPYETAFGVTDANRKTMLTEQEKPELRQQCKTRTTA